MKKLAVFTLFMLTLFSCSDSAPDLSEYQGINYIESTPLDPAAETNWVRTDITGTYITFTAVVPSTTTGLPAGTTDYSRLEILNLLPDGGFDGDADASPDNWTVTGGTGIIVAGDANTIHPGNKSLRFNLDATQRIHFNLDAVLADSAVDNADYLVNFKFNRASQNLTAVFEYNDNAAQYSGGIWKPKTTVASSGNNYDIFRDSLITAKAGADYFSLGSIPAEDDSQSGNIDDVRVVRVDQSYKLDLTVPYTSSGRPELISGNYRFSIYVKKEDAGDINPDPANPNRFPAETVTLYINNDPAAVDVTSVTDASWSKISADRFIQIQENDTIKLSIAPDNSTSPYLKNAGSILISAPSLYYISD